jgi:hypothetical protein
MITMITETTIKLGTLELQGYQIEDGSYAAPGLFRLMDTPVYRYQDSWYWVSPDGLPALEEYTHWEPKVGGYLSFDKNKLTYLHLYSVKPGRHIREEGVKFLYIPVSKRVGDAIAFCAKGKLLSDYVISRLRKTHEQCYLGDDHFSRLVAAHDLLRNTTVSLIGAGLGEGYHYEPR